VSPQDEIKPGMNLWDAVGAWRAAGGSVEPVHRTGEIVFRHPDAPRRLRVNGRRKDAPRLLTSMLRQVVKRRA
jgi:hypothetical protein